MIELSMPWPPTVNHYLLRTRSGGLRLSPAAQAYRREVWLAWKQQRKPCQSGRLSLWLYAYPPDARKRDLDNLLKAVLDALQHAGAFKDDSQVDHLVITRGERERGGRLKIDLLPLYC